MSWVVDHQVLLAVLVLVVLCLIGLTVLIVRTIGLVRTARTGMDRVQGPVNVINTGLADAERRVATLAEGQGDLTGAIEKVSGQTGELKVLLQYASRSLNVIRAPFRYLGK